MAITDWPISERPREKLLLRGPNALSDAELIAIFLRTGVKGKTAVDVARDLLKNFKGLRNLLDADQKNLCSFVGLGSAKYVLLQAALEVGRRYLQETLIQGDVLSNPQATADYLTARLRHYQSEVFACLYLDNRHRVLFYDELFKGTINGASVHPREVVKSALHHNAASVIFAHNHPSGVAEPSKADKLITRRLKDALALIDIQVLDHLVIGEGGSVSFAERGLL